MENGFKGLIVWKKSYEMALEMYGMTKNFPVNEQYGLVSQVRRAAISVSANIAEGYERKYRKEYIQFLMIAKGSLGELETYLLFARDLGYISREKYLHIEAIRIDVIKLLRGLINSLNIKPKP